MTRSKKFFLAVIAIISSGYGQYERTPASALATVYSIAGARNPDPGMRNKTVEEFIRSPVLINGVIDSTVTGKVVSVYDSNGDVLSQSNQTYDDNAKAFVEASRVAWNYAGGLVNESFYREWDAAGNLVTDNRRLYSYSEDGLKKQIRIQKWSSGILQADSSLKTLTYDASGLLRSYWEFNCREDFPAVQYMTVYRYDAQKRLVEKIFQFWDYTIFVNEFRSAWT
jgi:hypothetical protein